MDAPKLIKTIIWTLVAISLAMDIHKKLNQPPVDLTATATENNSAQSPQNHDPSTEKTASTSDHVPEDSSETKRRVKRDDGITMSLIRVEYCVSCSYKGAFQSLETYLQQRFPTVIVEGSEYPLTPMKKMLGKGLTFLQYGLYAIMMVGDKIFPMIGVTPPSIYYRMKEKKVMAMIGIMFVGNQLQSMASSTGAFEVILDGETIFSKLNSGRMPTNEEIDAILTSRGL
jgi:selT/selW/selH-like putative selenoprotein